MAEISIQNVVKRYGKTEVVHGINLEIDHNEFVVLVGPSGCGKSTTLRMIAGLEDVSDGAILIGGEDVTDLPPRKRNISMVFQNYALYPHMSVRENLGFGLKIAGMDTTEIETRVNEAAEILGLDTLMSRAPAELSGGQRQRVAMGRAIVRHPEAYLFDEPLSNLDAKLRVQMRTEIKKLHQKVKTTVVYVTHDQVEAMTLADRIVIMKDGHIEQVGTPLEVFNHPVNTFVASFIGSPPMNLLPATITQQKIKLDEEISVPIPERFKAKVQEGQNVIFGVRPDHLLNGTPPDFQETELARLKLKVDLAELLGTETLLYTSIGGNEVLGKLYGYRAVQANEELEFQLSLNEVHLFDQETGRAL